MTASRERVPIRMSCATGRQNGRHINQVPLFDIGVAQGELKRREGVTIEPMPLVRNVLVGVGNISVSPHRLARQRAPGITNGLINPKFCRERPSENHGSRQAGGLPYSCNANATNVIL
jgi:hypothetical protein